MLVKILLNPSDPICVQPHLEGTDCSSDRSCLGCKLRFQTICKHTIWKTLLDPLATLRAQRLKKFTILKFSGDIDNFKRATHQTPLFFFCGEF